MIAHINAHLIAIAATLERALGGLCGVLESQAIRVTRLETNLLFSELHGHGFG